VLFNLDNIFFIKIKWMEINYPFKGN
jgi:hypothetical protein